ncbi:unnamed protein product [Urochloa humidicola]
MMSPFELAAAAGVLILFLYAAVTNRHRRKLPPSPPSLPLLGHLHLIGRLAHRSLHELQLRYGGGGGDGLLLLQLGRRRTPVVSTAAAAADLFRNHDLAFASRPRSTNADKLMYGAGEEEEDFVDVLLRLRREGADGLELTDERIKATVKNMIIAATETSSHTLEWAMAELVANPRVMARLQDEIARVAAAAADNDEPAIAEAELSKMEYLRAVFKEVLRLHAPAPLLVPHESTTPAVVQGYEIPAKTALYVNAWAIGRDPAAWDAPEEFRPERFVGGGGGGGGPTVDFRGTDYQLIPFGAGRRICPGINFALPILELALAALLRQFDWELPAGMRPADLDMVEAPGLTAPRRVPLVLIPKCKALAQPTFQ